MTPPPRPIGEIFVSLGRITPADVERALAHQRERGGLFGEVLVELGLLTPEEVRWGLADQHGLPFVQLRADQIDRAVARRVPPRWAREHLVLPVLRDGDTVTAVIADPGAVRHFEQVRGFTGAATVDGAVCPAAHLRELIDSVFAPDPLPNQTLRAFVEAALAGGAERLGVSVRAGRVVAWQQRAGVRRRAPLENGWSDYLRELVAPFPETAAGPPERWSALLQSPDGLWLARCHRVGAGAELEWCAEVERPLEPDPRTATVVPGLAVELAAAAAHGLRLAARAADERAEALLLVALPLLPALLLGEPCRSAHLLDPQRPAPPGVLAQRVPHHEALGAALAALRPFALDAISLDLPAIGAAQLDAAAAVAPLVVVRDGAPDRCGDACIVLEIREDHLVWTT